VDFTEILRLAQDDINKDVAVIKKIVLVAGEIGGGRTPATR
jgi:hypothetical protein